MFRETLLESASTGRKRNRWPIALAFSAELIIGALLVALPLLTTGVISVSAHPPGIITLGNPEMHRPAGGPSTGKGFSVPHVMTICLTGGSHHETGGRISPGSDDGDGPPMLGDGRGLPDLPIPGSFVPPVQPPPERIKLSVISEGQLLNRADPVYPRPAILTNTQGAVRLHAIIAKDGRIVSLSVISGHPMLVGAAVDAVRQWRYRPYYLNGQAVEVETFITVNFKKTND